MTNDADRAHVEAALAAFIEAFNNFDAGRFPALFHAQATAFPPHVDSPGRLETTADVMAMFGPAGQGYPWTEARRTLPGPPYQNVAPQDTRIQVLGDTAIASFHLKNPGRFGRRTLVFQRAGEHWLIVHVHASNMAAPVEANPTRSPTAS